ncbi:unnamed protein product [Caenorhabditis angaria]|uniref:Uncharacterized protein n=1 Tax=Caenorhabditis angaria TaxID=860376 RepID=A0A9P1NA12_9PELO|nr:unnamed protein product [Caenorhabditis angaria]
MIIHLIHLNQSFWIPLQTLNNRQNQSWLEICIILILTLICAYMTNILIYVMWKIQKFHLNNRIICTMFLASWYFLMVGLLMVEPFEYGFLQIDDQNRTIHGLEGNELFEVEETLQNCSFLIGSFFIWIYISSIAISTIFFIIERSIATFCFQNYENTKRLWLILLLTILIFVSTMLEVFALMFRFIDFFGGMIETAIIHIILIPIFFYLKYHNKTLHNLLKSGKLKVLNSLTARFQIEENIKFFNIVTTVVICVNVMTSSFLILLFVEFLEIIDQNVVFLFLKYICLLNPLIVIPAVLYSMVEWRYPFLRMIYPCLKNCPQNIAKVNTVATGVMYFQQLDNSWR